MGIYIGLINFDVGNTDKSVPEFLESMKAAFVTSIFGLGSAVFLRVIYAVFPSQSPEPGNSEAVGNLARSLDKRLADLDQQRQELEQRRARLVKTLAEAMAAAAEAAQTALSTDEAEDTAADPPGRDRELPGVEDAGISLDKRLTDLDHLRQELEQGRARLVKTLAEAKAMVAAAAAARTAFLADKADDDALPDAGMAKGFESIRAAADGAERTAMTVSNTIRPGPYGRSISPSMADVTRMAREIAATASSQALEETSKLLSQSEYLKNMFDDINSKVQPAEPGALPEKEPHATDDAKKKPPPKKASDWQKSLHDNGTTFDATLYHQEVRSAVQHNRHHAFLSDHWDYFKVRGVQAQDENKAYQLITKRYPQEEGFVIEKLAERNCFSLKALIVEDDVIIRLDMKQMLVHLGYDDVSMTATGEEGIELVEIEKPDLILMDIRLQGKMDGREAAKKIRSLHDVPVIYITAFGEKSQTYTERAIVPSGLGYIVKPFDFDELSGEVARVLG